MRLHGNLKVDSRLFYNDIREQILLKGVWSLVPERAPRSLNSTLERKPEVSLRERNLGRGRSRWKCFIWGWMMSPTSSMVASPVREDGRFTRRHWSCSQEKKQPVCSSYSSSAPLVQTFFFLAARLCVYMCVTKMMSRVSLFFLLRPIPCGHAGLLRNVIWPQSD